MLQQAASISLTPPGVVVDHLPARSGCYVGSPSLALLPSGACVASHDLFGPGTTEHQRGVTRIFRSENRGANWHRLADVSPAFWSSLFTHRNALYLMGTDRHHGQVVIRRSDDGGATWTEPGDPRSGLLTDGGQFHTAPVPVLVNCGRVWRAVEDASNGTEWGLRYSPMMFSAPEEADLLDRRNWTLSNVLPHDRAWLGGRFGGWLEGNAVATPDGRVINLLRVDYFPGNRAAWTEVSADGRTLSFDPGSGFIELPGGPTKFTVRRDPVGGFYWTLVNDVPPHYAGGNAALIRNTLALARSVDLKNWDVRSVVLHHPDVAAHGFQYADWLFDGDDIVAAVRTAFDDECGGAHKAHDANFLTFHRISRFRDLTPADSVVDHALLASSQ